MFYKELTDKVNIPDIIMNGYKMNDIAYFDIETTGFDREKDYIILISLGYFVNKDEFCIKQFFAESMEDEADVLYSFGSELMKFNTWCSYNGVAFDEPFINSRMRKNNIVFEAPAEHLDLYRLIKPYYRSLGMERCNLKSVEKFIGIERTDKIDGGMSVELYYDYLRSRKEDLKAIIMLHNYEDVLNLPKIFKLVFEVDNRSGLKREDAVTEKQLKYLKALLHKNNITFAIDYEKISKKTASKLIDYLVQGNQNEEALKKILTSSY